MDVNVRENPDDNWKIKLFERFGDWDPLVIGIESYHAAFQVLESLSNDSSKRLENTSFDKESGDPLGHEDYRNFKHWMGRRPYVKNKHGTFWAYGGFEPNDIMADFGPNHIILYGPEDGKLEINGKPTPSKEACWPNVPLDYYCDTRNFKGETICDLVFYHIDPYHLKISDKHIPGYPIPYIDNRLPSSTLVVIRGWTPSDGEKIRRVNVTLIPQPEGIRLFEVIIRPNYL